MTALYAMAGVMKQALFLHFFSDKYRKYLEKARNQKTVTSPVVVDRSIDLLRHRYGSMPAINGNHSIDPASFRGYERTQSLGRNDKGYHESTMNNGLSKNGHWRGMGTGSLGMCRQILSLFDFQQNSASIIIFVCLTLVYIFDALPAITNHDMPYV